MGFEGPAISAIVSRLAEPKVNLAAYGGLVFPLTLMIEAPIIMLLAASTALSRDWPSYVKLRRFMNRLGPGAHRAPRHHGRHARLLPARPQRHPRSR